MPIQSPSDMPGCNTAILVSFQSIHSHSVYMNFRCSMNKTCDIINVI